MVTTANCCDQCNNAGKNIKPLLKQKQFEKSQIGKPNDEIALDFAGPFQNTEHRKKYLLRAIDKFSAWPDALFLHKPTTKKAIEYFKKTIYPSTVSRNKLDQIRAQHSLAKNSKHSAENSKYIT